MPGKQGNLHWFQNEFGFKETDLGSFKDIAARFSFNDGKLQSDTNNRTFHVGLFETPSCEELRDQVSALTDPDLSLGGLTFRNISDNATTLHMDRKNAGSVFQVASQFNCLEMLGPGIRPEDGVTRYAMDESQGPKCALCCPAATVYRNYLYGGKGQAGGNQCQIDNACDIDQLLNNKDNRYWNMQNGYLLPVKPDSMKDVAVKIKEDSLEDSIRAKLRVGIHWDTEVAVSKTPSSTPAAEPHRVCQVFCSALPLSYSKSTRSQDWSALARPVLDGAFECCLLAGAIIGRREGRRIKVFLTCLGGGAFGNPSIWVASALERALQSMIHYPLDVRLVHYHRQPNQLFKHIENRIKELATVTE